VCRALLHHDGIQLIEHCGSVSLQADGEQWDVRARSGSLARAQCVILATGTDTPALAPCNWLPLQRIRGQVTQLPGQPAFADLRAALCHEGYIAPARNGLHTIGATFDLNCDDPAPRATDNRANLDALAAALPSWRTALEAINPDTLQARVGFRCASPDYLPLVGPVPDRTAFIEDFAFLRTNAKHPLTQCGRYLPGLYLSTGHGSRGLTSTPIAAELLASMICGEPPPLSRSLCRALSPARFIVRDLLRNRL
jgi:tRNA 5-methylaminomethyl-2-thiouridine biosynthesis bifunctional protein